MSNNRRFLSRNSEIIALALLIITVTIINIAWIRQDTSPIPSVDANLYMFRTLTFVDRLESQGLSQIWLSSADLSMYGRPPLYQLMSVPFVLLFGRSMDSGLYVNLVFEILLLVATYNIGKLVENGKSGLLAAIIVAAYPPLIHLSRFYTPHFAISACVALTVWLLLLLQKNRSVKTIWLFGLSLAFGLYIHPFFIWAAPIPVVVFCLYIVFSQSNPLQVPIKQAPAWFLARMRDPLVLYGLLPASLVSIALVLGWYLTKGQALLNTLMKITSPEVIESRGFEIITVGFGNVRPSFWWYAVTSPHALSTVFAALLAISIVASLIKRQFPDLMLLALFVIGYITLSLQGALGWIYFPILPVAAALTGIWIGGLQNRIASSILIFLCVVVAIFNFAIVTWGLQPWNRSAAIVLGVPENAVSVGCVVNLGWGFCPAPPRRENWPVSDILRAVSDDPTCKEDVCGLMVFSKTAYLNWSVFHYYLIQDFPGARLSIPILPGRNLGDSPFNFPAFFNSEYLAYEDAPGVSDGGYMASVIRLLHLPPPAFASAHKDVAEFMLPNGKKVKLIRRVKPLTANEAETTIAAIDLPDKFKILQFDVLAPLYAEEGDLIKSISYYEQALRYGKPQTRVNYLGIIGRIYLSLGRTEEAIVAFQGILKIKQNNFYAHTRLAKIFQGRGDCKAANPHWLGRLAISRTPNIAYSDLGDAYLLCEDLDNAIGAYQDALKLEPRDPRAHLGLAMTYAAQGQTDLAVQEFQNVIQYAPESEFAQQAFGGLAHLYAKAGDLTQALSNYKQALEYTQRSRTRIEYLTEMGRIYLSLGRTEEAIVAFQGILKIRQNDFYAHTSLAKIFQGRGDCKAAIPHWLERLANSRTPNIAYSDLGNAYLQCEDLDKAIDAYQDALKLEPRDPGAHLGLAMTYAAQGQTDLVVQEFQNVIQYAPESEFAQQAFGGLAHLYAKAGDLTQALSNYKQALEYTQRPRTRIEYLTEMGRIYLSLGRTEDAIVAFQGILKIKQNNFYAHTSLAKIFQGRGDCKAAIPHWLGRLANSRTPNIAYIAYSDLGNAYLQCEDLDKAIDAYQNALKLKPRDARAHLGLGMSYAAQGQTDLAIQEFQKVIQYAPGSVVAQQAQEWLDNHK